MGLQNFSSFISKHNLEQPLNIVERLEKFKNFSDNGNVKPVIVFDFNQMVFMLENEQYADIVSYCGGRERVVLDRAENFFKKLISFNCKLVFVTEGPFKRDKLKTHKKNHLEKIASLSKWMINDHIHAFNPLSMPKSVVQIVPNYFIGLFQLAKKYGEYYIALSYECDKDVAYYANKYNALAVVSSDTDLLFFDGPWEVWAARNFNVKNLTTNYRDKKIIREKLNLNSLQMSLFASVYTLLLTDQAYVPKMHSFRLFELIASFLSENIRETDFANILDSSVINSIEIFVENNKLDRMFRFNKIDLIRQIEEFNLKNYRQFELKDPSWIGDFTAKYDYELYQILSKSDLNMSFLYVPHGTSFYQCLIKLKCRQIGIIQYWNWIETKENITFTFHVFENGYKKIEKSPIYPDKAVPKLSKILGYNRTHLSLDKKFDLLIWTIFEKNPNHEWSKGFSKEMKKLLNTNLFIPKLVLSFLLMNKHIVKIEANLLLISLIISEQNNNEYDIERPIVLNKRCIHLGYMYINTIYNIRTSLIFCGLGKYSKSSGYYDGYIFHNIFNNYFNNFQNIETYGDFSDILF